MTSQQSDCLTSKQKNFLSVFCEDHDIEDQADEFIQDVIIIIDLYLVEKWMDDRSRYVYKRPTPKKSYSNAKSEIDKAVKALESFSDGVFGHLMHEEQKKGEPLLGAYKSLLDSLRQPYEEDTWLHTKPIECIVNMVGSLFIDFKIKLSSYREGDLVIVLDVIRDAVMAVRKNDSAPFNSHDTAKIIVKKFKENKI